MNKIFNILLIILSICINLTHAKLPAWVNKPNKNCNNNEICAVGYGEKLNIAITDAKNNIEKIFETKVQSNFDSKLINANNQINEITSEHLQEKSEGILNGVVIKETYEENNIFYAFAVLNKVQYAKILKFEIEKLDKKLNIITSEKNFSKKSINKIYEEREFLNKKYMFLTGEKIPEKFSITDTFKKRNSSAKQYFYLEFDGDKSIKNTIIKLLSEYDIKITSKKTNKILKAKLSFEKEFLNVKGFEKYKVMFNIDLINNNNIINSISTNFSETGINFDQIKSKSITKIEKFINDEIENLIN